MMNQNTKQKQKYEMPVVVSLGELGEGSDVLCCAGMENNALN